MAGNSGQPGCSSIKIIAFAGFVAQFLCVIVIAVIIAVTAIHFLATPLSFNFFQNFHPSKINYSWDDEVQMSLEGSAFKKRLGKARQRGAAVL